jgi:hypothetical protein
MKLPWPPRAALASALAFLAACAISLIGSPGPRVGLSCFAAVEDSRHLWVLLGLVAGCRRPS